MCRNLPCRGLPLSEFCRSIGLSSLGTGICRGFCSVGIGVTKLKESAKARKQKSIVPKEWKAAVGGYCCARAQERTELGAWTEPELWQRRRRRQCRLRQKDRISDDCCWCLTSDDFWRSALRDWLRPRLLSSRLLFPCECLGSFFPLSHSLKNS